MRDFSIFAIIFISITSCSKYRLNGVYELNSNLDYEYSLLDIDDVEKLRCSFFREIKFIGDLCFVKYNILGAPMNLSSKYLFQDSIVSFDNPQFSVYGLGFLEVQSDGSLVLGNCVFSKNNSLGDLEEVELKNIKKRNDSNKTEHSEVTTEIIESKNIVNNAGVETEKAKTSPKLSVNQDVTSKSSPIWGEEKATENSKKSGLVKTEPTKTLITPTKSEVEATVQKAPEKPKVDQRAIFGAGGTAGKETQPASGSVQDTSTKKRDGGDPKGTFEGRAIMGNGLGKGEASGAGYSLDLAGWDFASKPTINDRVSTGNGVVVFKITIDNFGKVVLAVPLEYNVSNEVLAYYRQVVNQIAFKKQAGAAADFSSGKITFVIKID